ncbi:hypothetical protein LTSEWAN_3864, partial [Salmonella enterica subsp. enterica serovar Wandsworth str. A4-580]
MHIEIVGFQRSQRPGDKQQRVARQERRDDQAGFTKQNQKQNSVHPDAVLRDQLRQMHID